MAFHPKTRDSQNPYRTGVLVGNYVEDKFGLELSANPKTGKTGITEKQAKHSLHSTVMVYDEPPRTQDSILVSH